MGSINTKELPQNETTNRNQLLYGWTKTKPMKIKLYFSKGVEPFSVQLDVMLRNADCSAAVEDTERHATSYI